MTTRMINTKNIVSYGAVLASIGLSPHAQATIVNLGPTLPGLPGESNLPGPLAFSSFASHSFDLFNPAGTRKNFRQFNDNIGRSFSNNTNTVSFGSLANGTANVRLNQLGDILTAGYAFGHIVPLSNSTSSPGTKSDTGIQFIGFMTAANQVGWLKIDMGTGAGDPITYLAAAFNDTAGRPIQVGFYRESAPDPSVPEPSSIALLGLGLLATGATGIRKLRNTAKPKPQALLDS